MEEATVDLVIKLISTVGFPIFVAVWLLWRDHTLMSKILETLESLKEAINRLDGK